MKSEKGITLTSLIIYVIAMSVIVATIATLTNYFYGNINGLSTRTSISKEYTTFNSYFVNEINTNGNYVISSNDTQIVFSSGNQFKYISNTIYFNKVKICSEVTNCQFVYDDSIKKITVTLVFDSKTYTNEYTMQNDI